MNGQVDFDCHEFLDNTTLAILEISLRRDNGDTGHYEWLLINKESFTIKRMALKTRDSSSSVQERFFDLGFLKYNSESGIFIEASAKELHHLQRYGCDNIPSEYLTAVNAYLLENLVT